MKNRILRSALSVALCAAMLLSQGLTAFAENEIVPSPNNEGNSAAAEFSLLEEKAGVPSVTDGENVPETPASTEDETKTETTTGQPTAEDDTAKETTAKTPAVVSEEEKSEEATAAPAEAQAATNSLKSNWGNGCPEEKTRDIKIEISCDAFDKNNFISFIEQSVKVQIECVNENRLHNSETITWPLEEGSYSRGYWKIDNVVANEQGGCTATITVDPSYYLKDNGEHYLVLHNSILSLAFNFNAASETWEPVEQHDFYLPVTCEGPNIPSHEDVIKLLGGTMTVHCVNTNHNATETYGITWDSIGGLNKAPTDNGDGTYSLEITVSHDTYLKLFNQTYPNHKWATDDDMENGKVTLIWKDGEWSVKGKTDFSFNVLCDTKAPVEPTKPESDVLDPIIGSVSVKCVTNEKHTSSWSYLTSQLTEGSDYTIGELGNENGKVTCTITYIAKAFADKYNELQTNIDHFPFNDVAVKLVWNDETSSWELENKNLLNNVLVSVGCVLSEEEILADNLSVMVDCISDLNHEDLTGLSLEKGTFSIDEPYQIAGEYFFDIEVQPDSYLKKYAEEHPTYPEHSGNAVKLTYQWKDTNWEPTISEISFKVTCEGPNIPSHEDVIKLLGGTMTVHCVNTNHNATETYGITWDSIGGLNKAPTDNGDGTYSLEITVSHDTYLKLFNQTYPNHKWATDDDMENEKVTLIWKDGEWSVEDKTDFSFNVDCNATAPGGDENPDNPGGGDNGNNGGNNNGGSTGGGSSVSRRDDDDDWEPLPNNNYRVTKKNDKPSQNTQIVVRDPADNSDNTSSNTGSDSGKHNPETGDTTTAFAAMALAAVSLGGVVLLGRKKK